MSGFDPGQHLRKLHGNQDYLDVKWRIVWFRDVHPDGQIDTEHITLTDEIAVFRATVSFPAESGTRGLATGYGSETPRDFGDYIEKAETKAIGRALAALGYGTQFAADLEEGDRIADAPVDRAVRDAPVTNPEPRHTPQPPMMRSSGITQAQSGLIERLAREVGIVDLAYDLSETFNRKTDLRELTKFEASTYIDRLQEMKAKDAEPRGNVIPKDTSLSQDAMPGMSASDTDWMKKIGDVTTKAQLVALNNELNSGKASREVWDAYGRKAKAISATT